jgi:hypothetical protein
MMLRKSNDAKFVNCNIILNIKQIISVIGRLICHQAASCKKPCFSLQYATYCKAEDRVSACKTRSFAAHLTTTCKSTGYATEALTPQKQCAMTAQMVSIHGKSLPFGQLNTSVSARFGLENGS